MWDLVWPAYATPAKYYNVDSIAGLNMVENERGMLKNDPASI